MPTGPTYGELVACEATEQRPISDTSLKGDGNIKAYYTLDTNANDSSPYNNNMTNSGIVSYTTPAMFTGAAQFAGSSDLFVSPVMTVTNNWTICGWFYPTVLPQTNGCIVSNGLNTNGYGLFIGNGGGASGSLLSPLLGGVTWINPFSTTTLVINTWYHAALVRRSGTTYSFLNGKVSTTTSASAPLTPTTRTCIGGIGVGVTYLFTGAIDDVALFDRALSNAEILSIYRSQVGSRFAGYWRLNGNATDETGNGGDGSYSATPPTFVTGRFNKAANFVAASSESIIIPAADTALQETGNHTVSVWVNPATLPTSGNYYDIFVKNTSVFGALIRLNNTGGTYTWWASVVTTVPSTVMYTAAGGTPTASVWTNVINVYDNTAQTVSLYVNGVLATTPIATGSTMRTGAQVSNIGSGFAYFNGMIDEVIVDRIAWSAAAVEKYYKQARGRFGAQMV